MGFTKSMCKAALKKNNNNMDKALDKLLENCERFIGVENSESSEEAHEEPNHGEDNRNLPNLTNGPRMSLGGDGNLRNLSQQHFGIVPGIIQSRGNRGGNGNSGGQQ